MSIKTFSMLVGCTAAMIAINADNAQAARNAYSAIRAQCYKQVGAYHANGRWHFYGKRSSPQRQNFFNCLDAHTMKKR